MDKSSTKDMIESIIQSTVDKVPGGHCEGLVKMYGGDISNPTLIRVSVAKKGQSKSWVQTMNDYMKHIRDGVSDNDYDYTRQGRVSHYGIEIYKEFEGVIWYEFEPMPTASAFNIQKTYQNNKVDRLSQYKDKAGLKVA